MTYRLVTYRTAGGRERAGALIDGKVHDVAALLGRPELVTSMDVLDDWVAADAALRAAAPSPSAGLALDAVTRLAPLTRPGTLYIAGGNYADHVAEMTRAAGHDVQLSSPFHVVKAGRATIAGPGATVRLPRDSQRVDWEVELAVVIGTPAKDVPAASALDHVAGYAVANDLSCRDLSRRAEAPESVPFRYDWIGHKCFDGACPLGPWLTPAADVPDPGALDIGLWLNGEKKQASNTRNMVFGIAEQIAALSHRITLYPGDIILTGTPAGTGANYQRYLQPGDVVRAEVQGLGELVTHFS